MIGTMQAVRSTAQESMAPRAARFAGIAFVVAALTFLSGGIMVIWASPPPSEAPVLGMLSHGLWALAITLLAIGATALPHVMPALQHRLSSRLASGALGVGVVLGLQWVTWAYVDVRAAQHDQYELALATVITPFGAGHVLMYGVLLGAGVAFLGRALAGTLLANRVLGLAGVAVGTLTLLAAAVSIVGALEGGVDGHWLYNVATLLLGVCYLWAMAVGAGIYSRARSGQLDEAAAGSSRGSGRPERER